MAEGLMRMFYGDRFAVYSAGTQPGGVHPHAIAVMRECGLDISGHRSQHVDEFADIPMDYVMTVCDSAREHCPYMPARKQNVHQRFRDPSAAGGTEEEQLAVFREVRQEIRQWRL